MSDAQRDIRIENLIEQWQELSETWDGKDLKIEQQMQNIEGELADYGINTEDLKEGS